ncbi:MAG: hypothetical protein J5753_05880 [Oscillospiraceae bacterium]|nr:hypothetical protein [Oscillospiraceae bacterium]
MNKIIVQVYLPVNGITYEIRLPDNMYVRDVTDVLSELFSEIAKGFYSSCENNVLCFREQGESLPQDRTLRELGICNRSRLMFI